MAATLTVNGIDLALPGFAQAQDLSRFRAIRTVRGDDFTSQGVDGATFRPKVLNPATVLVQVLVENEADSTGTPYAFPGEASLQANFEAIEAGCVSASMSALVPLVLTFDDASTRTASVYCPRFEPGEHVDDEFTAQVGVLEIVIPAGVLT